jgi:hypothetical protein
MTIDERIAAELRRHAPQVDEPEAWDRIQSALPARRRGKALRLVSVSVAAFGFVLLGFVLLPNLSSGPPPASGLQTPFLDTWVSIDSDGSTPTMMIDVSEDGTVEMLVHDEYASVCSGAPSTMTGTGRLEGTTTMVVPSPVLTCDDGGQPEAVSAPPLEELLRELTFVHDPESDMLTDNFGSAWTREGAEDPGPEPTVSTNMWPQTNLEEVREAQERADAGDPDYTWQVDPDLGWNEAEEEREVFENSEIVIRFLGGELGWEEFRYWPGGHGSLTFGALADNAFIRCAPGSTNPLYPTDPTFGGCAPTIDDFRYEWVSIDLAQPAAIAGTAKELSDPSGIWVVSAWRMLPPFEQMTPPSEAEIAAVLEDFLQARIEGEGAESHVDVPVENAAGEIEWKEPQTGDVPLLYATTTGAAYERSEFEVVAGPMWPDGQMQLKVRLFAQSGRTVVEQLFLMNRNEIGQLGLQYCSIYPSGLCGVAAPTTENGQAVPLP